MPRSRDAWIEPSARLPLRWGTHQERIIAGLMLIIAGGLALAGTNNWTLPLLAAGTITNVVGWSILPAAGWRRMLAIVPGLVQIWLLLTGPQAMWTFALGLAAWLLARHRPPRAWLVLALPIGNAFIMPELFEEYSGMPAALTISLAVTVASAWIARWSSEATVTSDRRRDAGADGRLGDR